MEPALPGRRDETTKDPYGMAAKRWHKSDIKAALEKRGLTLSDLDQAHALKPGTCSAALRRPHRRAEQVIAETLGLPPVQIWPGRYRANGERLKPQPSGNYRREAPIRQRSKSRAVDTARTISTEMAAGQAGAE